MNEGDRLRLDIRACPDLTGVSRGELAEQGVRDALSLMEAVRDFDPRQVWGRLNRWGASNPARLLMATVALAALADPDRSARDALAWTDGFREVAA